jgi:hypothetical protein
MKKLRIADCRVFDVRMAGLRFGLFLAACVLLQAGCTPCPTTSVDVKQLVGEYNANAAAIPKLWTRSKIDLSLVDDKGSTSNWSTSDGLLLTGKANAANPDFVLVGRESGQEVMRLGTSSADNRYYAWYHFGDKGGAWTGRADRAGATGATEIFADPLTLVSLLGIVELPPGSVTLNMDRGGFLKGSCAYVLTCQDSPGGANRLISRREIYFTWTQDGPRRVFQVICFGRDGRRVLTAKLSDYGPVSGADVHGQPAIVPTDITMVEDESPGHKSHLRRLRLNLSGMKVGQADPSEAAKFWDNLPPVLRDHVIDVDKPAPGAPAELPATAPTQERR